MTDTPSQDEIVRLARQAGLDLPAAYRPGTGRGLWPCPGDDRAHPHGTAAWRRAGAHLRAAEVPAGERVDHVGPRLPDHRRGVETHRRAQVVTRGTDRGLSRPDPQAGPSAGQLRDADSRARAGRGEGRRSSGHGRQAARQAARHSLLPKRHLRHGRHPHDGDVEVAGRQCSDTGCLLPGEDGGGGRRAAGQERDLGVRPWRAVLGHPVSAGAQSVEQGPFTGRFLLRLGGGRRRGLFARHPGQRHRRLDPRPGRGLRDRRPEADLWSGQPARRHAELFYARSCRSAGLDDRGCGDPDAGRRRPRPGGSGLRRRRRSPTMRRR